MRTEYCTEAPAPQPDCVQYCNHDTHRHIRVTQDTRGERDQHAGSAGPAWRAWDMGWCERRCVLLFLILLIVITCVRHDH